MGSFWQALGQYEFLQVALLAGLLASVASGVVGTYVVVRRIAFIAGGISHCVLGGMGVALYLRATRGWEWLHPLHGAVVAALLAAILIGIVSLRAREREDTVIGALWALGMAVGVVFIKWTPGYQVDLMSYLFGTLVAVTKGQLWLLVGLDALAVAVGIALYNQFQAVCFDEEFARLRGLWVEFYYVLLLCLTALTVVLLTSVVGLVMVIALLTLPVAIANFFCRTLWQLMLVSGLLSTLFITLGVERSYTLDLPPGATTILLLGAAYLLVVAGAAIVRRRRRARHAAATALSVVVD